MLTPWSFEPGLENYRPAEIAELEKQANAVRVSRITEKPGHVVARLAKVMAEMALGGAVTDGDLKRRGFTDAQLADHGPAALQLLRLRFPNLEGMDADSASSFGGIAA